MVATYFKKRSRLAKDRSLGTATVWVAELTGEEELRWQQAKRLEPRLR